MLKQSLYLSRMLIFLAFIVIASVLLYKDLLNAFMANTILNGTILAVLILGVLYMFRQIFSLKPEVNWLNAYRKDKIPSSTITNKLRLLSPMATMLKEERGNLRLSAPALRSILDGIGSRLDEDREISRYLSRLLIFLGLLGTFWGLLQTIYAVGDVISNLSIHSNNPTLFFTELKNNLKAPLSGMGTGFSSSLFGLSSALILGFLDLQAGQAQSRFYNDLEEWLSSATKLSQSKIATDVASESLPAYLESLLEKISDSLEQLERTINLESQNRNVLHQNISLLTDRLMTLNDQMMTEQSVLLKFAEGFQDLKPLLQTLSNALDHNSIGIDDISRKHIRNLEILVKRINEDIISGRNNLVHEIRNEIRLLAKIVAKTQSPQV